MRDEHDAAIRALLRRVAVVGVDDSGSQQRLQLSGLASEQFKNVVRLQDHGFASNPPAGGEGLLLPQGGRSDRAWAFGFEHQKYRQANLPSGATAIYDSAGNIVSLLTDHMRIAVKAGHIEIDPGTDKVYLGGAPDSGAFAPVMTVNGPSTNIFAKVG